MPGRDVDDPVEPGLQIVPFATRFLQLFCNPAVAVGFVFHNDASPTRKETS